MTDELHVGQSVNVNLDDLFVHTYICQRCEESSFVDVELVGPHSCDGCGDIRQRVSDEPLRLSDLVHGSE